MLALPVKGIASLVQFNPNFYRINPEETSMLESEFKFILSVATYEEVYIYTTCSNVPLYILSGLHYASLTDLAWNPQGLLLAATSMDGYVTFMSFEQEEFGPALSSEGRISRNP